MPGRLTLGLYNSYDPRRFSEAHRRALVRAAPLALAYDASLATFGFPFDDLAAHGGRTAENRSRAADPKRGQGEPVELRTPAEIADYVAQTTSVAGAAGGGRGRGGGPQDASSAKGGQESDISHFVQLAKLGRFQVFELPKKGFPPQLGTVVLTTEHAAGPRATSADAIARELAEGRSQLLVFGLGPQGTPAEVREMSARDLDITGKGVGLETATAMGAVVAAIAAHVDALRRD